MAAMHVLHLEAGRHLYGGPRQVLYLLRGLAAAGVRCSLVAPAGSALAAAAPATGAAAYPIPIGGDLDVLAVGRLFALLRQLKPDLVHVHSRRGADFFGAIAAGLAGTPALLTRRVDHPDGGWLAARKYAGYARVAAISRAVMDQLRAGGLPPERLALVPSAVDPADCAPTRPRAALLQCLDFPDDALLVAVVAQLIPRKGHDVLLRAWPAIRAACPAARLVICGIGPLREALEAQVRGDASVRFTGFRPDLREWLGHVDVLVHPALTEGLGVAVLEAQAAGVPVVASATGGLPEAVAADRSGLLVPPGEPQALATAVQQLLGDPARRAALGAGGPAHVVANFSVAAMTRGYLALYRQILGLQPVQRAGQRPGVDVPDANSD